MSIAHSGTAKLPRRRSTALARLVKERDFHACVCCGFPGSEAHHIDWVCDGGADTPENMVTLCRDCHRQAPEGKDFLAFQRRGGSVAWLFSQMTAPQRCGWHLYGWWTFPEIKSDPQMEVWRQKSNAALEKTGRQISLGLAPVPTFGWSHLDTHLRP